jgi:hypothetical protein
MSKDVARKSSATPVRQTSSPADIAAFKAALAAVPVTERRKPELKPRLIFAMDATGSRQPTWDMAMGLQADMVAAAGSEGLEVALGFYRGYDECKITGKYYSEAGDVTRLMTSISPQAGDTQIGKLFQGFVNHAEREDGARIAAFIGDCFEEGLDSVLAKAGELKRLGFRVFMFQEGDNPGVESAFKAVAEATGSLHAKFDQGSAAQLRDLMRSVVSYAARRPNHPALTSGSSNTAAFQRALAALPPPAQG